MSDKYVTPPAIFILEEKIACQQSKIDKLEAENKVLREGLEFYTKDGWKTETVGHEMRGVTKNTFIQHRVAWKIAEQALAKADEIRGTGNE